MKRRSNILKNVDSKKHNLSPLCAWRRKIRIWLIDLTHKLIVAGRCKWMEYRAKKEKHLWLNKEVELCEPHALQIFSIIVFFVFIRFVGASWNLYATWFIAFIISIHGWRRIASQRIKVKLKSSTQTIALTHTHVHLLSHRFGQLSMGKNVYATHTTAWNMCIRLIQHKKWWWKENA